MQANSTQCEQWMSDATWEGKDVIRVDEGYWRYRPNSSSIIEWLNKEACPGGYIPGEWALGYRGYLWSMWDIVEGQKYQPLSGFQWSKWPDSVMNAIRVVGVILAAFWFLVLLIFVNLRKRKDNQLSILFRILTNYIHLISATLSFNVKIPSSFTGFFSQVNRISSPNETFFSFDCFIEDYDIKLFAPSNSLFKLFLYMLLPIILFIVVSAGLALTRWIINAINPAKNFELKRSIVVSMICIVFLFHPTLTNESLSVFLCNKIEEGDFRMTHYMEYKWYSWDHIRWTLFVGAPILIVWVIALPIYAFLILTRYRNQLEDINIKKYFLLLYQGLKPSAYYWEFVNTFRKFSILAVNALANTFSPNYKLFMSVGKFQKLVIFFRNIGIFNISTKESWPLQVERK